MSMSKPSDLVQGTLDMLLLKILALAPMNGFAVSQRLKQVSGDVLQVSDGSLYPALHKLEQEGWITSEWKKSINGGRAKYYSLTRLGRRQFEKEADSWGSQRGMSGASTEGGGDAIGTLAVHDSSAPSVVFSPKTARPRIRRRAAGSHWP
jgi:transcriptional regulator